MVCCYLFFLWGQRKRVDIYVLLRVILLVRYPVLTHQDHFVFYKNVIQFIRSMLSQIHTSVMKKKKKGYLSAFESLI